MVALHCKSNPLSEVSGPLCKTKGHKKGTLILAELQSMFTRRWQDFFSEIKCLKPNKNSLRLKLRSHVENFSSHI